MLSAKRRSPWLRRVLSLVVVGAIAAGGYVAWPHLVPLLPRTENVVRGALTATPSKPPPEEITFEVTLRGYKPWKGSFIGSAPGQFDVELQKR